MSKELLMATMKELSEKETQVIEGGAIAVLSICTRPPTPQPPRPPGIYW